jgi:hypothetical protein
MKTLIEIDTSIWAKVKYYATIKGVTIRTALEQLLNKALIDQSEVTT